jgi:hypothetical protein
LDWQILNRWLLGLFALMNPSGILGGFAVGILPHSTKGANRPSGGLAADVALAEFKVFLSRFHHGTDSVQKYRKEGMLGAGRLSLNLIQGVLVHD